MTALQHDLGVLVVPTMVLLVASILGWGVIGLFPKPIRSTFTPAAPAIGVGGFVVAAHVVAVALPMRIGAWGVLAIGLALVVRRAVLGAPSRRRMLEQVLMIVVPLVLAAGPIAVAMLPIFRVDTGAVEHPTNNYDAIWYVTNGNWLVDHRATEAPHLGAAPGPGIDPPSDLPARNAIVDGFRIGESLVQSTITTVDHVPLYRTWLATTAAWLALLTGGCVVLASVLGLPRWIGAAGGFGAVSAGLLGYQVLNQNGASVLGVVLLPVVIAAVLGARERSQVRVPLWVAALLLGALSGVYSELMVTVGPALFVGFVVGDKLLTGARRFAGLVLLSLALAPFAWLNTVRSLVITGAANSPSERHSLRIGTVWQLLGHYTGELGLDETVARPVRSLIVVVVVVIGFFGLRRVKGLAAFGCAYVALNVVLVAQMVRTKNDYTLERVVMLAQPTILLLATIGLAVTAHAWTRAVTLPSLRSLRQRPALLVRDRRPLIGVLLVAMLLVAFVQERAVHASAFRGDLMVQRSVRDELVDAADAVRATGAPDGSDALVSDSDYFDRLWLGDLLRDRPQVAWTQLTTDYFFTTTFVGNAHPRWFLVDDAGWQSHAAGAVYGRLQLVDSNAAPFTQIVPVDGAWAPDPAGGTARAISGAGSLLVVRSDPSRPLTLHLRSTDSGGSAGTIQVVGGDVAMSGTAGAVATAVSLQLPPSTVVTLAFSVAGTWLVEPDLS